jgi:hypothetical protein
MIHNVSGLPKTTSRVVFFMVELRQGEKKMQNGTSHTSCRRPSQSESDQQTFKPSNTNPTLVGRRAFQFHNNEPPSSE